MQIGYSLINDSHTEVLFWGDQFGQTQGVPDRIYIEGVIDAHGVKAGDQIGSLKLVPRMAQYGNENSITCDGSRVIVTRVIPSSVIDAERDRRLALIQYAGKSYDFDESSQTKIAGAGTLALAAIINGAQVGNLRWANATNDFAWIAHDNSEITMDAQTTWDFATKAAQWMAAHLFAGRALKNMSPIPIDYASDSYWPTGV